ncbi:MAG TPA: hypothetical protein VIV60_17470 [Polyangiaceae bacterium]
MTNRAPPEAWLARVHHDLVKRLLWTARDCRELGRQPLPGELLTTLYDAEGQVVDAATLWAQLREDAPSGVDSDAPAELGVDAHGTAMPNRLLLDDFATAIGRCAEAASRDELAGVLRLEVEFERLRTALAPSLKAPPDLQRKSGKDH